MTDRLRWALALAVLSFGGESGTIGPMPLIAQVPPAALPPGITAFVDVSVIPMDTDRVLLHQTVLVEGGRITALGPSDRVPVPAGATRIDGQGKFLLPGLANMHTHLQGNLPIEKVPSPALREWILLNYLASGITTVRNMGGEPWHVELREQVARGELLGPRIYTAGPMFGTTQPVATSAEAVKVVAAQHAAGYDFVKLYIADSLAIFDSLIAAAGRLHMPVGGHTPPLVGLERMLRAHVASIEHLTGYFEYVVHRDSTTPEELDRARQGGVVMNGDPAASIWIDRAQRGEVDDARIAAIARATQQAGVWNCPAAYVGGGFYNIQALTGRLVKALHDAGAGLVLGTDGGPKDARRMTVQELQTLVTAGLTPYQALATGTRDVARFWGTQDSSGTIAVGKRADLVLLDANPLQDVHAVAEPVGTMVGGRWHTRAALEARLQALADTLGDAVP